jgi:hypothetical protein
VHSPWRRGAVKPDLVLIDGRFRLACFLHPLLAAAPGTPILFDDYTNRPPLPPGGGVLPDRAD